MRITKKIPMVRYMARISEEGKEIFDKEVWIARKTPPTCPYYKFKFKIKIIKTEDRFDNERGKKHE